MPLRNHKVLVANRGEIACRVFRACRELGLPSVAVYSDADAEAVHTWMADERVHVGASPSAESYLLADRILAAAAETGATIIHPGYGFLSENASFREACDDAGVKFAGPGAAAMRQMGIKTLARDTMKAAGVPVVPGSEGAIADSVEACRIAAEIGLPVMIKAAAGGGGKGIRFVADLGDVADAFGAARREAIAYFNDDTVYIEKAIVKPRHVEVQVLADEHGNTLHVLDRECSVQRRNQKVIEESPAPNLSDATRQAMGAVAVQAARAVNYVGAGTIEFLVDANERFYFLEMNTRLQVEHPVTELVTGVDLVVEMLRIAAGLPLSLTQAEIAQRGHAIECRVYAEDPSRNFMPSPGTLHVYRPPSGPGVRIDDGVREGSEIPRFYDPMIAKLSVWAEDRQRCIKRAEAALNAFEIAGISHNVAYLLWLLNAQEFVAGAYDTGIVARLGDFHNDETTDEVAIAIAALLAHREASGGDSKSGTGAAHGERAWSRSARVGHVER
jgi:acetyl-CoA carboxylase, biotin carboxylase subunit